MLLTINGDPFLLFRLDSFVIGNRTGITNLIGLLFRCRALSVGVNPSITISARTRCRFTRGVRRRVHCANGSRLGPWGLQLLGFRTQLFLLEFLDDDESSKSRRVCNGEAHLLCFCLFLLESGRIVLAIRHNKVSMDKKVTSLVSFSSFCKNGDLSESYSTGLSGYMCQPPFSPSPQPRQKFQELSYNQIQEEKTHLFFLPGLFLGFLFLQAFASLALLDHPESW